MTVYSFDGQLEKGKEHEAILDAFFSSQYEISEVPSSLQQLGMDRIFVSKKSGVKASVEYKTDFIAQNTGNVFIETESVDNLGGPGWAFSSMSQILIYFIPEANIIFMADMLKLKLDIDFLCVNYGIKSVKNETYTMLGTPVPIDKFREYVIKEITWRK